MADNTGTECIRCGKGHYKVFDLNDAIFGELHCDNCGHHVKFNQDLRKHLSRQAQAMLDAVEDDCIHPDDKHRIAAAALRAAARQLTSAKAMDTLRAIADELDPPNP